MIIRFGIWFSVVWFAILLGYCVTEPKLFLRMFPHELGEFLAGAFAPLAVIWVGVTVWLQRQQLNAQNQELTHSSEALRLQSAQFQQSIDLMTQNGVAARLDRLSERVTLGVLRGFKAIEPQELRSPEGERLSIGSLFGTYGFFAELFRARETEMAMSKFGEGLSRLVAKMDADWVLDTTRGVIEELCVDLTYLDRVGAEMERLLATSAPGNLSVDTVDAAIVAAFRKSVAAADRALEALVVSTDDSDDTTQR